MEFALAGVFSTTVKCQPGKYYTLINMLQEFKIFSVIEIASELTSTPSIMNKIG
jgi:hypothetical protein